MNFQIECDYSPDRLRVDTENDCVELEIHSPVEDKTVSVLLHDRVKLVQLRDALSEYLKEPGQGESLARWWGLSYASWLTMPRVLMQAMPAEWQERAGVLLEEYCAAFPNTPDLYIHVTVSGPDGKRVAMPEWVNNYRHPKQAEIDKCRGVE